MDLGRGFSVGNSWATPSPENSFPARQRLIPVNSQPAKSNWGELIGIYSELLQENPENADVADQNFTSIRELNGENWRFNSNYVDQYVENFGNQDTTWSNNPLAECLLQNGYGDVLGNSSNGVNSYTQFEAASSLRMDQNAAVGLNQNINGRTLRQMPNATLQQMPQSINRCTLQQMPQSINRCTLQQMPNATLQQMPQSINGCTLQQKPNATLQQMTQSINGGTFQHMPNATLQQMPQSINRCTLQQMPNATLQQMPQSINGCTLQQMPNATLQQMTQSINGGTFQQMPNATLQQMPQSIHGCTLQEMRQTINGCPLQQMPNARINGNQRMNGYTLQQMTSDVFQMRPKSVGDASSSITNLLPYQQLQYHQRKEIENHVIDNCSTTEKDKQVIFAVSDEIENRSEELLQNIVNSSSLTVSKTATDKNNGSNELQELRFDLNKTPEQKTPAKRRKHRPKVVKEGTPKVVKEGTPKTPLPTGNKKVDHKDPKENPSGKRKYVRKKGVKVTEQTEDLDRENDGAESVVKSKSCRRALNFDSEDKTRGQEETDGGREKGFNLNLTSQENDLNEVEKEGQNGHVTENNNQVGSAVDLNCSSSKMPGGRVLFAEKHAPLTPQAKPHQALNLIARNLSSKNLKTCEILLRADTTSTTTTTPHVVNSRPSQSRGASEVLFQTAMAKFDKNRGSKREYCRTVEQIHSRSFDIVESPVLHMGENNGVMHNSTTEFSTPKKMKMVNGFQEPISSTLSCTTATPLNDFGPSEVSGVYVNRATSQINSRLLNSYFQRESASRAKLVNGVHGVGGERRIYPMGPTWSEEGLPKRGLTRIDKLNSLTTLTRLTQPPPSVPIKESGIITNDRSFTDLKTLFWETESSTNDFIKGGEVKRVKDMHVEKGNVGPTSSNQESAQREKVIRQNHKDASDGLRKSPIKPRARDNDKHKMLSVDEVINMLKGLKISGDQEEQNALVPYKGDNRIVPYEEFDPIKKRKARPKVDLDPETDRIWRLLMGKEGSEGTEATDKSKEKWWEEERNVFRGRVDSFIARMHLVQGDRRFSRWKGSVVDSVIGVFLTQNVSDHLSSSAFMSLAAKFPLHSKPTNEPLHYNGTKPFVEEPETQLPNLGHIQRQPMIRTRSIPMHESPPFHQSMHHLHPWTRTAPVQIIEDIRSRSNANFEAEDPRSRYISMINPGPAVQMHPQFYIQRPPLNYSIPYMQNSSGSSRNFQSISGESTMTFLSRQVASTTHINRSTINQQQRMPSFHNPNVRPFSNQIPAHQGNIKWRENGNINQNTIDNQQNSLCVEDRISVIDKKNHEEKKNSTEANGRKELSSSGKGISSRKGKADDEKNKAIDWDSLRKQVQLNGKKERSKDTMDSLDYEALRCADVSEISNTIKERGMNNMLAERIKDFLNRIVREHGSIDLEWLRDVAPDKSKDYLLSVRGLGLKSVECVRLLTLHHLAFPVDTNVGRIAVRLGWVPLQPLPESLQLHLLELYPVLETIQKYLWPRLCKLDQRTLYELHYQMITFGKVFCTKSKPNCNACPMRGECRHFASAFASARLALPGPEEKSIVSSAVPLTPDKNPPPVMTKPLALPATENSSNKEVGQITRNCEPIIEEPATPEPEITESDIENAFYEDPDEIPEIKLDIEEFAVNLHNYMQDNMELQDGDMSKALVALNPDAASIPTPKLKNVSRLRTEHQVYELPDGHPLLKGLDKREPDDPSPYLLAIWTPGETANSFQPPESNCRLRETGTMCDDPECFSCNCQKESNSQTVRGTILIPCRTAMRGSFPLNGTYFQVNEMFADHESSIKPIDVPRAWIWNLPRRTVYFGTSVSAIFRGLSTEGIQYCFWRGFVCVRGFELKTRAPKPLMARLHFPASKLVKTKNEEKQKIALDSRKAN